MVHLLSEVWRSADTAEGLPAGWQSYVINADTKAGMRIGPVSYVVDEAPVRRYSGVMGVPRALYPTVPAKIGDILYNKVESDSVLNARMMVELRRPVQVGDLLTVTGSVLATYERRGKPYITLQFDTTDERGAIVERTRKTLIRRKTEVSKKWNFLQTPTS
jgi:hypothetical protein